jgi:2-polyprenyl-6-methoxyphenol hydroxylase-like FAD-dependent oxidoreductase
VKEALLRAGGLTFNMSTVMPHFITDRAPREGDERFVTVTGRRPTVEYAVASAADRLLPVMRGVWIMGLLRSPSDRDGIPHITGVRTMDGEEHAADLIVDAMGRRSKLPDWLEAIGARRPIEEAEESRYIYYTRFFRSTTGRVPAYRAGFLTNFHSFSLLILPGDSHTWSVTVFAFSGDPALKALRDPKRWTALVRAYPLHAHWLDGEPITDVLPMAGVTNRYRRFVVDGAPVATGIVSVGDAWACTNPIGGRGISIGLMHTLGTVEVVQAHRDDPLALALAQDAMTETRLTPWYQDTVELDRKRTAQINATIHDRRAPQPADPGDALLVAMMYDAELFRASIEITSLLALPQEVMARPGVIDRIMEVATMHEAVVPPGPSRDELLRMVA